MNDDYPLSRNRWLPWFLERGLCDPELAAEYLGRKLLSKGAFAQARKEVPPQISRMLKRRRELLGWHRVGRRAVSA